MSDAELKKQIARDRAKAWYYKNSEKAQKRSLKYYYDNRKTIRAKYKKYLEENDEVREVARKRASEHYYKNLVKSKEVRFLYRSKNKERQKILGKNWYENNKGRHLQNNVEWRKENPEKVRAIGARRKALEKNAEGTFCGDDIKRLYFDQKGCCFYCGKSLESGYDIDHYIPLTRGGSNYPENLRLACPRCNRQKQDKMPEEFIESLKWDLQNKIQIFQ